MKHVAHFLEFMCHVTRIIAASVREYAEVWAPDFNPRFIPAKGRGGQCCHQKKEN
ncbi:MAG: hypothetical protein WAM79_19005 [Candidatus Sulfotelmatobacter sp.]